MTERKTTRRKKLSEEEIDKIVVNQADEQSAWGAPIRVRRPRVASISISARLAARAVFLADLHGESDVEEWLQRIIRERVELEERAFAEAKRELAMKRSA